MTEMNKITSRSNERLAHARKVRDGKVTDQIFIEGLRLAEEALRSRTNLLEGFVTPKFAGSQRTNELVDELARRKVRLSEVDDTVFKTVSDTVNSQGIILLAERPATGLSEIRDALKSNRPKIVLFLYEINDPSNLGAIFRTAEAAGVSGLVLSKGSADAFSPKTLRAAMGSNLRLPIWPQAEVTECVNWAHDAGIRIVATDISGQQSYTDFDWTHPSLLIFGSEAHGLSDEILKMARSVIKIPMKNGVESLNLAVSAGIILFEAVRQNS